jgi:hypothetical protein
MAAKSISKPTVVDSPGPSLTVRESTVDPPKEYRRVSVAFVVARFVTVAFTARADPTRRVLRVSRAETTTAPSAAVVVGAGVGDSVGVGDGVGVTVAFVPGVAVPFDAVPGSAAPFAAVAAEADTDSCDVGSSWGGGTSAPTGPTTTAHSARATTNGEREGDRSVFQLTFVSF